MSDRSVIYIDPQGNEHLALVISENQMHPGMLTLGYVKDGDLAKAGDVPHMSDPSRAENNPGLPQYSLNCWKELGEVHQALPTDHPAKDHPFEPKQRNAVGSIVEKPRPEYDKHIAEHLAANPSAVQPTSTAEAPVVESEADFIARHDIKPERPADEAQAPAVAAAPTAESPKVIDGERKADLALSGLEAQGLQLPDGVSREDAAKVIQEAQGEKEPTEGSEPSKETVH